MNSIDKSNFRQFILQGPAQFKEGSDLAGDIRIEGSYKKVCVSGMGGSALPANLLRAYLENASDNPPEIIINRYYSLPGKAKSPDTLHFVASYSGNTEETLSSLAEIESVNGKYITFSSGGKLEELSKQKGTPHIKLPFPFPNYQPRMGTGYFFSAMLKILINQKLVDDSSAEILNYLKEFETFMARYEEKGKKLSEKLNGKTPIIYASPRFKSVAMVWKIKLNENAKTPAFWNFFPELNHNEMVGFTNLQADFFIVMLRDPQDNPKNLKRYDATAKLLKEQGIESEIIDMDGDNTFSKMFLSISLADWTSYYLALKYNQDPTPVEMVEKLKKILA